LPEEAKLTDEKDF